MVMEQLFGNLSQEKRTILVLLKEIMYSSGFDSSQFHIH